MSFFELGSPKVLNLKPKIMKWEGLIMIRKYDGYLQVKLKVSSN